jgi:hypothetical protein
LVDAEDHSMSGRESLIDARSHPAFDRCFRIYRNALIDWNASGAIQAAAATLGMGRRAYCDSRLSANQFSWVAAGTGDPFTQAHANAAYIAAKESAGVV